MFIPHDQLQPDTLYALIEEFVTRGGAVHGHRDTPLATQMQSVLALLEAGQVVIVFDENEATCSIVPKESLPPQSHDPRHIVDDENPL